MPINTINSSLSVTTVNHQVSITPSKPSAITRAIKKIAKIAFVGLGIALGAAAVGAITLSIMAAVPIAITGAAGGIVGVSVGIGGVLGGVAFVGLLRLAKKTHQYFINKKKNQSVVQQNRQSASFTTSQKPGSSTAVNSATIRTSSSAYLSSLMQRLSQTLESITKSSISIPKEDARPAQHFDDQWGSILADARKTVHQRQVIEKKVEGTDNHLFALVEILSIVSTNISELPDSADEKAQLKAAIHAHLIENELPSAFADVVEGTKTPIIDAFKLVDKDAIQLNEAEKKRLKSFVFKAIVKNKLSVVNKKSFLSVFNNTPPLMDDIRRQLQTLSLNEVEKKEFENIARKTYLKHALQNFNIAFTKSRADFRDEKRLSFKSFIEKDLSLFDSSLEWKDIEAEAFNVYMHFQLKLLAKKLSLAPVHQTLNYIKQACLIDFPSINKSIFISFKKEEFEIPEGRKIKKAHAPIIRSAFNEIFCS